MNQLEANLACLPASVASAVRSAPPRTDERVQTARDGRPVNGLLRDGRLFAFHSAYAPLREADRAAAATPQTDVIVCMGLGSGYLVAPLLERCERLLVVEPDLALIRSGLLRIDLTAPLRAGRLVISPAATVSRLSELLGASYIAAFHREIRVVELAGRVGSEPERFSTLREALHLAVEALLDDVAVQARFGRLWHRNTVVNLARVARRGANAGGAALPDWRGVPVIVAAAGPSLVDSIETIRDARSPLLAVDTAAPILTGHGVHPDLVLTIDAQVASYHHALCSPPLPAALDLAAPPSVGEAAARCSLLLTAHPLHVLIGALGLPLPRVDVRGGNVTQAALDLAATLGASEITLVGADFSYPDGNAYPRGSYVHRHHEAHATRRDPLSSRHYRFIADRDGVYRDPVTPSTLRHPLLDRYARSFAEWVGTLPVPVTRVAGRGIALELPRETPRSGGERRLPAPGAPGSRHFAAVLAEVSGAFDRLHSRESVVSSLNAEATGEALTARALLPLAAAFRGSSPEASDDEIVRAACAYHRSLVD